MIITEKINDFFKIKIFDSENYTFILFNPETKKLNFTHDNKITRILRKNEYQLRKILHNKRKDTFYVGFSVKFALRNNKQVIDFNNLNKIVVLDKTKGYDTYVIDSGIEPIIKIFTDGCYLGKAKKGGYVALVKNMKGLFNLFWGSTDSQSSSMIELMAAIKGLEATMQYDKLRIITDSRYVIKGLTEWIINWKLNDWHTAQGEKVKNIALWQHFDKLTDGKYIEFQWVKAHSFHFENTICDFYAKLAASK